ncbi:MAG: thiamine pyrophosphate-dependent enzyme, partial [Gemmatimonadota bacterium]|nr:thiamine pyrophosphate-dependent enzyme [Gemmatimonadota bacterium]
LVAGPSSDPGLDGSAIARFAVARGVPTLGDPLSGARFDPAAGTASPSPVLGAYDHFLRLPEVIERHAPDLIIRVGRTPTSGVLEAALAEWSDAIQVVIDDGGHRKDHQGLADHYLHASAGAVLGTLAGDEDADAAPTPSPTPDSPDWLRSWTDLEAATWAAINEVPPRPDHEGDHAAAVVRGLPSGATLFVSSSMPVRDVDAYARPAPRSLQILGNRGASGIDGVISTVLGCAAGGAWPMAALVGDIAFYHDMNGLLAARDRDLNVVFVVVDNDGGGIFHMLPIRDFEPVFTPYFATPHGLDFRHAARMYGLPLTDVTTPEELEAAVAAAVARPGTEVLRVRTDRDANRLRHREVRDRVALRLQGFLNRETP